jgi:outer membrane protein assembly factor BamB
MKSKSCLILVAAFALTVAAAVVRGEAAEPLLSHSVYFKLNDRSQESKQKLVEACRKYLTGHPGTVWFATGMRAEEFDREVNDRDYDVALYLVFQNQEAHDRYQVAPRHDQFIEEQRENWASVRVFDSWIQPDAVEGGTKETGVGPSATSSMDWPQWRGPDRTGVSKESGLLQSWSADGPRQVWVYKNAGEGYSAPAIVDGKLFTLGTRENQECLLALDANTGEELWSARIGPVFRERRGNGPRGTPTVDADRVYALSGQGDLICANVADGKVVWRSSLRELGGEVPNWGYTESVLVDGDHVICTPGGSQGALAALEKRTGRLMWQSSEFTDPAHYSSMVVADVNGTRQYIQRTERSVVGIAAQDGALLWRSTFPGRTAVVPTPIYRDGLVYVTAGYGAGSKLIRIGTNHEAEDVYENNVMKNHHGGVILLGDHVYGYSDGSGWICQDFESGEEVWSERDALGKGAIAYADGRFYCLDESTGTIVLIEASPDGWQEHGRYTLAPQTQIRTPQGRIWTHPVISHGKLYLRDQDLIHCYDIRQQ